MNFKKFLALGLAVASVPVALTGCSKDEGIVFWHTMGKDNMATLDTLIADFNKIYPEIKITHYAKGGFDELQTSVSTALSANNQPHIAYCYPDHVASYLSSKKVLDFDQFIDSTELIGNPNSANEIVGFSEDEKADFVSGFWDEGTVYSADKTMYSFPFSKSTEVLFYNKTAFDLNSWDVPTTWDEMWALCAEIKGTEGYEDVTPLGYDSENNMFITLLEQNNLPYTSVSAPNYIFDTTQAQGLMTGIQSNYKAGYFTTKGASGEYTSTQFTTENLMMTIGSTGGASYNLPSKFDYGIAPIPQVDGGKNAVIQQGPSLVMFDCGGDEATQEQLDAWKFIKFITNTENSASYAGSTGYMPVRQSSIDILTDKIETQDSKVTIQQNAFLAATQQVDAYFTSPAFNGSTSARVQVGYLMNNITVGTLTVSEAFAKALDELNK